MAVSPLEHDIQTAYQGLKDTVKRLSKEQLTIKGIEFLGSQISISDLLAYQIGWGQLLLYWYRSGLENIPIQMPGEGFDTWDYKGIAFHFFQKYSYDSFKAQQAHFESICSEIVEVVKIEHRSGNLHKIGVWQWCQLASGKQWPLSKWVTVNTRSPYQRARLLIKKFLRENAWS